MALPASDPLVILVLPSLAMNVGCLYLLLENHNILNEIRGQLKKKRKR